MKSKFILGGALLINLSLAASVYAEGTITLYETHDGGITKTNPKDWNYCGNGTGTITAGPQAPRDIDLTDGANTTKFKTAYRTSKMNLCDIHYHWNAEHKSAEYSVFVSDHYTGDHAGFAVVEPASTDPDYRAEHDISHLLHGEAEKIGVIVGDTIEVHFVHTSCNVNYEDLDPANGLGNCATNVCANPQLRVVAQVFKVVDHDAEIEDLDQPMNHDDARVVYTGSTTGSGFNNDHCSPYQVTWDVKKTYATISAHGLAEWSHKRHQHAHGVRELVTRGDLLSTIKSRRDDD